MFPQPFGFIGGNKIKVGMFIQGGILVYYNSTARQGLIADNQYTTDGVAWGPNGLYTQTAGYGYGYSNTESIINTLAPASGAIYTAWNLTRNGYSDWFIPTREEASYIYQTRQYFPFWDGGSLWTSEYLVGLGGANAYAQVYDGSVTTYTRSETSNRRSIACRYYIFPN